MRSTGRAFVALSFLSLGAGCNDPGSSSEPATVLVTGDLATDNGLSTINGLTSTNGLSTINGLSISNGLSTINGLSSTTGLMTTADGRITAAYLIRCALPATRSIVKQDQYGTSYTFHGAIGIAPQWETGPCDNNCQQVMSACMLAHINTSGIHVPLWIVGQPSTVGWGLDATYPNQEGAFFGNIFVSPPKAYYCNGSGVSLSPAPGRIGSVQVSPPYVNAYASSDGLCATATHCMAADKPNQSAGFKSCSGTGGNFQPLTVWRAPWTN